MLGIFLKNAFFSGLVFTAIMSIFDLIIGDPIDPMYLLSSFLFFGIFMGAFVVIQLKYAIRKRGVSSINESQILDLTDNSFVNIPDIPQAVNLLSESDLGNKFSIEEHEAGLTIKPRSRYSSCGDPIHVFPAQKPGLYQIKPRRRWLSPDLFFYLNALNVKQVKGILSGSDGQNI